MMSWASMASSNQVAFAWKRWHGRYPVPVQVGEGELCAGVRALAATDQPGPLRPGRQVDQAGELRDPCALAWLTVLVDRWRPGALSQGEDLLAEVAVDRVAQRIADPCLPARGREIMARPRGIRAGENVPVQRALGKLLEREFQHAQMNSGVVST